MKKNNLIKIILGFILINSYSIAEIELANSFFNNVELGYSGFEFGSEYNSSSIKNREKTKDIESIYKIIDLKKESLLKTLENDNRDRELLLSVNYGKYKIDNFQENNASLILGKSKDINSRIGIEFNYGNFKFQKEKGKNYSGNLFYYYSKDEVTSSIIAYMGRNKFKDINNKNLYYGLYGRFEKKIPVEYIGSFDYLEPSIFFDTTVQRFQLKEKNNEKYNSDILNSTLGFNFKNETYIDNNLIKTNLAIGYNREFFKDKKYKVLNKKIKENSLDKVMGQVGITFKYNEFLDIYGNYKLEKSLNESSYSDSFQLGIKVKF